MHLDPLAILNAIMHGKRVSELSSSSSAIYSAPWHKLCYSAWKKHVMDFVGSPILVAFWLWSVGQCYLCVTFKLLLSLVKMWSGLDHQLGYTSSHWLHQLLFIWTSAQCVNVRSGKCEDSVWKIACHGLDQQSNSDSILAIELKPVCMLFFISFFSLALMCDFSDNEPQIS